MTQREREILIASVSWTDKSLTVNEEKAFQAGARWADKTMIEKACEWLYVYYPTLERSKSAEDACEKFKKAMEE